jgi:hypothetical protein
MCGRRPYVVRFAEPREGRKALSFGIPGSPRCMRPPTALSRRTSPPLDGIEPPRKKPRQPAGLFLTQRPTLKGKHSGWPRSFIEVGRRYACTSHRRNSGCCPNPGNSPDTGRGLALCIWRSLHPASCCRALPPRRATSRSQAKAPSPGPSKAKLQVSLGFSLEQAVRPHSRGDKRRCPPLQSLTERFGHEKTATQRCKNDAVR